MDQRPHSGSEKVVADDRHWSARVTTFLIDARQFGLCPFRESAQHYRECGLSGSKLCGPNPVALKKVPCVAQFG